MVARRHGLFVRAKETEGLAGSLSLGFDGPEPEVGESREGEFHGALSCSSAGITRSSGSE